MGTQAAEKCDDFGWHPRGRIDPGLVAETTRHPSFGAGRAWSNSAGYSLTTDPQRLYLVYTVEGAFEFDVDGRAVVAEAESLVLFEGAAPTLARTLTTTARFVWYLEPTFLQPGRSRFRFHEPVSMRNTSIRALMTMTNTLLNAPTPTTASARRHTAGALEHLVAGALDEAGALRSGDSRHRDGLFMASQVAIEAGFRDAGFDVTALAREVSVSVRTLHDTFARLGTTPRREIERRRLTEARRLTAAGDLSVSVVAEESGFSSIKQLRRALGRAPSLDA